VSARLKDSLQTGPTSSANYLQRKHSIDALLLIALYQCSRTRGMQLGVTTCSHHRLWTWSRLVSFCGDVLEETFETVTWGPHRTRSTFRIADGRYTGGVLMVRWNGKKWYVISNRKSHGIACQSPIRRGYPHYKLLLHVIKEDIQMCLSCHSSHNIIGSLARTLHGVVRLPKYVQKSSNPRFIRRLLCHVIS
jgi:hypothetical protein